MNSIQKREALTGLLDCIEKLGEEFSRDMTLRAIETFLHVAKEDLMGTPATLVSLGNLLRMDMPRNKSTVQRNIQLFNGMSRNQYLGFHLIDGVESASDSRVKELGLNAEGKVVVNRLCTNFQNGVNKYVRTKEARG